MNRIAVVELAGDFVTGRVVRTMTPDDVDVPTTIAALGDSLYAVNARFGTASGPDAEYSDHPTSSLGDRQGEC